MQYPQKKIVPLFVRNLLRPLKRSFFSLKNKIYQYYLFLKDFLLFKKLSLKNNRFTVLWQDRYPQIQDRTDETLYDPHYLYHPAWAARIIAITKPKKHIDISSALNFSTIISAFVPVEFYDYRPANIKLSNFDSKKANLLSLPFFNDSIESLSCMHTIEHIGLGRYGDTIDPEGDIKAIAELKRVVAKNGNLLIIVPIGKPRVMFNAHRIYSYTQMSSYFDQFELKEFSLIPDNGRQVGIIKNASQKQADSQRYGCGLFWFIKK